MSMIRLNPTRWPYSLQQLRLDEPTRSFSDSPSDAELAFFDAFRVQPTAAPVPDLATERVIEVQPAESDGVWLQQWEIQELSAEEQAAYQRVQNPPQWVAFGSVVQLDPGINALMGAALQAAPALGMALAVGLGKAADGDSRVFMEAWTAARGAGLVSAELLATLQAAATAYHLPDEFVTGLAA